MNEPSSSCEIASTRSDLARSILECVADLERAGFLRPASLSPDAYLAALGELDDRWAAEAVLLSRTYAELRFGAFSDEPTAETASESWRDATLLACTRLTLAVTNVGANDSEREGAAPEATAPCVADLAETWRARWIESVDEARAIERPDPPACHVEERLEPSKASQARTARTSVGLSGARSPKKRSRPARRLFSRSRGSRGGVPVWNVAALALATTILAGVGGVFGERCGISTLLSGGEACPVDFANGPIVRLSEPLRHEANDGKPETGLPQMFPSHYPHAERFNGTIAASWLKLAELYCDVDRCDRAEAIYNYVAKALPRDPTAQIAYASFLLTAPDVAYRSPARALAYAEYGYELDPESDRAAETLAAALFATGDVARAVSIQEERLERTRRPDFAGVPFDALADRNAG